MWIFISLPIVNRAIEKDGVLDTARKHNIPVLAFGVLQHGMLWEDNPALDGVQNIAKEKNITLEKLLQVYVYEKNPDMSVLIGTTKKEHLRDSMDALSVSLSDEDISRIEDALPIGQIQGRMMRNFTFRDGKMEE